MMWRVLPSRLRLAAAWRLRPLSDAAQASRAGAPFESLPSSVQPAKVSAVFSLKDSLGALQESLQFFWKHDINMTRIESRPSKSAKEYDFYVDFEGSPNDPHVKKLIADLKSVCSNVVIIGGRKVPWFPRREQDLDLISQNTLDAGDELQADHPGFKDTDYRNRRAMITAVAQTYQSGQPIARIDYSEAEKQTWAAVWDKLYPLIQKHACQEYLEIFPELEKKCGYSRDSIPQLEDISQFLQEKTGFRLRPVPGLLSARDFFAGLAFRRFFSTQYIRHHSKPLYTPEPDIVHEVMGHAPMFANKDFADFSQEIGLASIGATDEQITWLARCYWFTVEFGICQQNGQRKAYGAGLLSSFGELEYSMSGEPKIKPWDPNDAARTDYPITTYQPLYYLAESFEEAKNKLKEFADTMPRPFHVRYNEHSQSLDIDRNVVFSTNGPPKV